MLLAGLAAMMAGVLLVGRPPVGTSVVRARLAPITVRPPRRPRLLVPVLLALTVPVIGAGLLGGIPAAVVCACVLAGLMTGALLLRQRLQSWQSHHRAREVAQACSVLAAEMRLGKVPASALASAAEDCPVLQAGRVLTEMGGDPATVWLREGEQPGAQGLLALARAWRVSTRTGAGMEQALTRVAEALREDRELELMVSGELAAPRMTSRLLSLLPAVGCGLGFLIGGDPIAFLTGNPIGQACLLGGVLLCCAGLLWTERLAAGASRGNISVAGRGAVARPASGATR